MYVDTHRTDTEDKEYSGLRYKRVSTACGSGRVLAADTRPLPQAVLS